MRSIRVVVQIVFLILTTSPATARATLINWSDFWGVSNGVTLNVVQQGTNIVATGFLYDSSGNPTWISFGGVLDQATNSFSGDVIQNRGNPPSSSWSNNWNPYVVGYASVVFTYPNSGQLTLTLNGSTTIGTLRRASLGKLDALGLFVGSGYEIWENCTYRANGVDEGGAIFNVSSNAAGDYFTIRWGALSGTNLCTFYLPVLQAGSVIVGSGTFSCSDGGQGNMVVTTLRATDSSLMGQIVRTYNTIDTCRVTLYLGAWR